MNRLSSKVFWTVAAVLAGTAVYQSAVFVDETEYVVVTRFGEIVAVYDQVGEETESMDSEDEE
ncbi:MAG: hypothetical protein N2C14_08125, partial [Planctomycetales bacterium]